MLSRRDTDRRVSYASLRAIFVIPACFRSDLSTKRSRDGFLSTISERFRHVLASIELIQQSLFELSADFEGR
jgi:hypothetical protein